MRAKTEAIAEPSRSRPVPSAESGRKGEGQFVIRDEVVISEINRLWLPVYPYMADHLLAASGATGGRFLDLGPFAGGLALSVVEKRESFVATVIDESEPVLRWVQEEAKGGGYGSRLTTRMEAMDPIPESDASFDLVAVRGAFFFLTPSLLREVKRVLMPGGFGWVGGGYGPTTPDEVIRPIAQRSRVLNEAVGKRRITPEDARILVRDAGLEDCARVATEGGLWIEVRG